MKLRDVAFWTFVFGPLAFISYWAIAFTGPWRWVAELLGYTQTPHHRSLGFAIICLVLYAPFAVVAEVWKRRRERSQAAA